MRPSDITDGIQENFCGEIPGTPTWEASMRPSDITDGIICFASNLPF